jgi:hypothetical protein
MAAILGSAFWDDRTAFRRAGAFLELFGLLQVAYELRDAGILFNRAPVRTISTPPAAASASMEVRCDLSCLEELTQWRTALRVLRAM